MSRDTSRFSLLQERVEAIYEAVERDFLADDDLICSQEQPILRELTAVINELTEADAARLGAQEMMNQWLRGDPVMISRLSGRAGRRLREVRREIATIDSDAPEAA